MTAATDHVSVAAVLVAAGAGERLSAGVPKAFVEVDGRSLLAHAFDRFAGHPRIREVVVVLPAGVSAQLPGAFTPAVGGRTRQQSVAAGLAKVGAEIEIVLVHDVARPFVPPSVIDAVTDAVAAGADAAIPVVPVHDTVRRIAPDGSLAGTVDRSTLVAVQTPQGFRRSVLAAAHEVGRDLPVTDDAALVEAAGGTVVAVPGAEEAFKVTTPADLARAGAIAERVRLGSATQRRI